MSKTTTTRIRMNVSIAGTVAGRDFSAQPGDVCDVESRTAATWIKVGHASLAGPTTPLTARDLNLRDLDMEEGLTRSCEFCEQRSQIVFQNKPLCFQHFRGQVGH